MLKEFREFILRGNLVDLAVAVVIGTRSGSRVADLITPLTAALGGRADVSALTFEVNESTFISDIPVQATRCAFCTTQLGPPPTAVA